MVAYLDGMFALKKKKKSKTNAEREKIFMY